MEATVKESSDFSRCFKVGFIIISSSTSPTKTPLIGPSQGISEILKAIEVPIIAVISGEQSSSTDITVHTTDTSFLISLGNNGRIGLSITLEASTAFSDGFPSLLEKEPGIFPTE